MPQMRRARLQALVVEMAALRHTGTAEQRLAHLERVVIALSETLLARRTATTPPPDDSAPPAV